MKKICLCTLALSFVLCGCGRTDGYTVNCDGSTSMGRLMAALSESFRDGVVNFSGTGSGAGVESVLRGECDLGLSSRKLTGDERRRGAVAYLVARDGVAVVVNPENPLRDLSFQQLRDIFTGKITNWNELGGMDAPIAVLGREAGSGTRAAFEAATGTAGACVHTCEYNAAGDIAGSVARNINAVGYTSFSAVGDGLTALSINGIPCQIDTLMDGSYPITQPFLFVTRGDNISPAAQRFLDYALSPQAAEFILLAGAVPPGSSIS